MKVTVFLMCYNERAMVPSTVRHYRTLLTGCRIVVYDNESSDASARIARDLGCSVRAFSTADALDENVLLGLRNNCWKDVQEGWVIICDMDEFLCIDRHQLAEEEARGTTMLTTRGFEIVGKSASPTLDDVDITLFDKGYFSHWYSKRVCFRREALSEINFAHGCHTCEPAGRVVLSKTAYPLYHMKCLGLPYYVARQKMLHERARNMRRLGLDTHYSDDEAELANRYGTDLSKCQTLPTLSSIYRASVN